eukprot:6964716-Prymnesium_polylepis.1
MARCKWRCEVDVRWMYVAETSRPVGPSYASADAPISPRRALRIAHGCGGSGRPGDQASRSSGRVDFEPWVPSRVGSDG